MRGGGVNNEQRLFYVSSIFSAVFYPFDTKEKGKRKKNPFYLNNIETVYCVHFFSIFYEGLLEEKEFFDGVLFLQTNAWLSKSFTCPLLAP